MRIAGLSPTKGNTQVSSSTPIRPAFRMGRKFYVLTTALSILDMGVGEAKRLG
jgi:hypothetical protein